MRKTLLLLSLFSIALLLNNCKNGSKYVVEMHQLDSLQLVLNNNEKKLQSIDMDKANAMFQNVEKNLAVIQQHTSDSLRKEVGVLYHNYSAVKKGIKITRKNVPELKRNIEYSRRQIDALKQNLEIEKWEQETVLAYMYDEEMAVVKIDQGVTSVLNNLDFSTTRYDSLNPEINNVVEKLLAQ